MRGILRIFYAKVTGRRAQTTSNATSRLDHGGGRAALSVHNVESPNLYLSNEYRLERGRVSR